MRPSDGAAGTPLAFPPSVRAALRDGDARIVVTGAGGWLGQATLAMLDEVLGEGLPDRVLAYAATARPYRLRSGRMVAFQALDALVDLPPSAAPTLIAHYAFLTREKASVMPLDTYVAANRRITALVAREADRLGAAGTFSTSSGAVYERAGGLARSLGGNPYGVLKLEEEAAFAAGGAASGRRAAICRAFNLGGPFLNKIYALGSLVDAVLAGGPVRVESARPVLRSYAHVRDVVAVGFAGMIGPESWPATPYDTAGEEAVEVGELAERVCRLLGRSDLPVLRPPMSGEADRYVGDAMVFRARAAAAGLDLASLDAQILDTAADRRRAL